MDGGPSVTSVPGSGSVLSGGTAPEDEGALTTGVHLQLLFQYYCRFGRSGTDHDIDTLDNAMYAKFTRDCPGLLARPLGAAECDLLFLKHKAKALRRATYGQWLDILSDMAAAKYPDLLADGSALPTLLSSNILCSSPALGIAEAVRGGLIRVEAAVSGPLLAGPRSRSPSLRRARSPSRSPSAAAGRSFSPAGSVRVAGGGGGGGGASPSAPPSPAAPNPAAAAGAPSASASSFASYMQAAAAQMAALAAQAASAADAVTAAAMATAEGGGSSGGSGGGSAGAGAGAAAPSPLLQRSASPSAVYQVLARTAKDFQVAAAAAAVASSQQQQQQQQQRPGSPARSENLPHGGGGAGSASGGARALRPLSASQRSVLSSSSAASATSSAMHGALSTGGGGGGGGGAPLRLASPNPFRAVPLASGEFVISSQSLGAGGSGASRAPPPPPRSPGGGRYEHLGTPLFTPALAGEANAPGSVYERLANPESFTGVYRRAWESDGRINQYADTSASLKPSAFVGNTNTCSDETITDIRTTLRPNLSHQPALGINRVSGRPAFR